MYTYEYIPGVGSKELRAAEKGDMVKRRIGSWGGRGSQQNKLTKAAGAITLVQEEIVYTFDRSIDMTT